MTLPHWLRRITRATAAWSPILLLLAATAPAAQAASQACAHLVTGTYLSRIVDAQGNLLSRSILNFHAGGTLLSLDSNQAGIPGQFNPFTSNTGEWACTGRTSLIASILSFTLPGTEVPQPGLARNNFDFRIDPRTGNLEGSLELIFYPLEGDPLNGVGIVAATASITAQPLVLRPR